MKSFIIQLSLCRYLQKDKVNGPEGNTIYYELAERASDELISEKVKEYISQVVFWKLNYASFLVTSFFSQIHLTEFNIRQLIECLIFINFGRGLA